MDLRMAEATLTAYLDEAGLEHEAGRRSHEHVVVLPGERKLKTVVSILLREELTSVSAFVIRNPDENHAQVHRWLLRRNLRMAGLAYAIDDDGDIWVRGSVPTSALSDQVIDRLFGVIVEAVDGPFNELLLMGFESSMRKEWDWRVARGESLANLEAFRAVLERPQEH